MIQAEKLFSTNEGIPPIERKFLCVGRAVCGGVDFTAQYARGGCGNAEREKKEPRIKTEFNRLKTIYSDLPDSKKAIVFPLLQNLAFMKITLDDLQQSINENGCSEDYKNGENQYGRKAAADLQAYNSLIKNYNAVSDRLEKLLPPEKKESRLEAFNNGKQFH